MNIFLISFSWAKPLLSYASFEESGNSLPLMLTVPVAEVSLATESEFASEMAWV